MKLTVLGCAGTYPGPESGCSSYLVEQDGFRLLLDAGNGAVGALQRHGGLFDVDAVVLTHLHADHCVDLIAYAYARIYHPAGPPPVLPLYGPRGTEERLLRIFDGAPADRLRGVYDTATLVPGVRDIGPFRVTAARVAHPVECHALRLEAGGESLVYSGDTGPTPALTQLATGADLFLCEASWLEGSPRPAGVHLTGREAGQHASGAGAGRLLLTHLVPWGDEQRSFTEASEVFRGTVTLARAGGVYPVAQ